MKTDILFSIVVPTYNRAESISDTIKSVLTQTYPNFELIVVDDGSTDDTEELVKAFSDPRVYYYKKQNAERGAARNYGTARAKGDYVTFLDSDDVVYPRLLEFAKEDIDKFSSPPFFHMGYEIKNNRNQIIGKKNKIKNENTSSITKGNYISCIGVFMRKDVSEKFKFSEDVRLSGSEDWELWIRVVANEGVQSDDRVVACFKQHDERSVLKADEEQLHWRKTLFFQYAFQDQEVMKMFTKQKKMMESYFDVYIALHLALARSINRSFFYLRSSLSNYPFVIFDRRFYAVIKHLVKNILSQKLVMV